MTGLQGRRVLVTGATGFIGGRLVEKLSLSEGAQVRALVSAYSRCARIARFPVELHRGDLLDRHSVEEAAKDCDVIFHCAYGSRGSAEERKRVTVDGAVNVVAAARSHGARVVHLSTQMVYGVPADGEIDESCERYRTGSTYADSKLEAEEKVLEAASRGVGATVLQPTAVYGPYAPVWTVGVLERMKAGKVPLVDGGAGSCNAVYVDDVVDAMLLSALSDTAVGEAFLISAAQPVSWGDFYAAYESMLGFPATVPMSAQEALAGGRQRRRWLLAELPTLLREPAVRSRLGATVEGKLLRRALGRLRPRRGPGRGTPELDKLERLRQGEERPVYGLEARDVAFFSSKARVSIDKARRKLGYRPSFDLAQGMELTGAWARWANLVPSAPASRNEEPAGEAREKQ